MSWHLPGQRRLHDQWINANFRRIRGLGADGGSLAWHPKFGSEFPPPSRFDLSEPFTLASPVGRGAANSPGDVAKVQAVLGATGDHDLAATDGPTGHWSPQLDDNVRRFQKRNTLKVDGLLNPGGPTMNAAQRQLAAEADNEPRRPGNVNGPGEWRGDDFKPDSMSEQEWRELQEQYGGPSGDIVPDWLKGIILKVIPPKPPETPSGPQPGGTKG